MKLSSGIDLFTSWKGHDIFNFIM